jgi:hypothetical protein
VARHVLGYAALSGSDRALSGLARADLLHRSHRCQANVYVSLPASYLTRVLLSKEQSHWRDLARAEIRKALLEREKEALEIINEKGGNVKKLEFDLSKAARVELGVLLESLSERGERVSPPQVVGSFGDRAIVSLSAAAVTMLLGELG